MRACPWVCPVCRGPLDGDPVSMTCPNGHRFDVARQGYVNLLVAGQRRSRQPGDSPEMIGARRRFLATGAYDRMTDTVAHVVGRALLAIEERDPGELTLLDVGCGEGHHTRRVVAALAADRSGLAPRPPRVCAIDVAKPAVSVAATADREAWYAVASAADVPVADGAVDVALNIFGPVVADDLARVVRAGGTAVVVHPGPEHLASLRALVYEEARAPEVKDPLRHGAEWFTRTGSVAVTFPVVIGDVSAVIDLFTMTPYRWHAPPDIASRLASAAEAGGFETTVDVVITSYVRRPGTGPAS